MRPQAEDRPKAHPFGRANLFSVKSQQMRDMHQHPGRYVPFVNGDELINHSATHVPIAAPRYSPEDLGKSMGRFELDRARLLSNGMQEFLYRL